VHSTQHSALALAFSARLPNLTIRGGGKPYSNLALMPTDRMGPPPGASPPMRMTASWSGSNDPTEYKCAARDPRPMASSPRILNRPTRHRGMRKARLAVHHRSACSGVKALRNTSLARRQAAKLCYRFGPLTPSARSANLIAGDGTKNGFPAPNKEPAKTKNDYLTGKAPYRFESGSLQRRVGRNLPASLRSHGLIDARSHEMPGLAREIPNADVRIMRRKF
jgi:hypothetical protein